MAYETKVLLNLLAQQMALLDTAEEAYQAVAMAASVEGVDLPSYAEMKAKLRKPKTEE